MSDVRAYGNESPVSEEQWDELVAQHAAQVSDVAVLEMCARMLRRVTLRSDRIEDAAELVELEAAERWLATTGA